MKPKTIRPTISDKNTIILAADIQYYIYSAVKAKCVGRSNVEYAKHLCYAKRQMTQLWRIVHDKLDKLQ